jgi:hypothetical protein
MKQSISRRRCQLRGIQCAWPACACAAALGTVGVRVRIRVAWDGRDDAGAAMLRRDLYLVVVRSDDQVVSRQVVRIR